MFAANSSHFSFTVHTTELNSSFFANAFIIGICNSFSSDFTVFVISSVILTTVFQSITAINHFAIFVFKRHFHQSGITCNCTSNTCIS